MSSKNVPLAYSNIEPRALDAIITQALVEDIGQGDRTTDSLIAEAYVSSLDMKIREDGIIAGLEVAKKVFLALDPKLKFKAKCKEGDFLKKGAVIANITGSSSAILKSERVALNFLQRLSGIATQTKYYVDEARKHSNKVRIVDTRKTTPNLRLLEKHAVLVGGGYNHRYNLADCVMIKDNHLAILAQKGKSIVEALELSRKNIPHTMKIEIEVDNLAQVKQALKGKADIIMLDNMSIKNIEKAVALIDGNAIIEVSGGVQLENIAAIAKTGIDVISVGALTHSVKSLDIGLDYKSYNKKVSE